MKSLYESLFDVEDNIENMESSLLIGGKYDIDVDGIRLYELKKVFKIGLLKVKAPYDIIKPPKIEIDDVDPKINKMVEKLCEIILNIPVHDLEENNRVYLSSYCPDLIDNVRGYGGCHLAKTVGGHVHFYVNAKSIRVDLGNGIKTYKTPSITIPLIKRR
jgi:hypothetical protein